MMASAKGHMDCAACDREQRRRLQGKHRRWIDSALRGVLERLCRLHAACAEHNAEVKQRWASLWGQLVFMATSKWFEFSLVRPLLYRGGLVLELGNVRALWPLLTSANFGLNWVRRPICQTRRSFAYSNKSTMPARSRPGEGRACRRYRRSLVPTSASG